MTTDFSDISAAVDAALIVVTTAVGEERAGCLVGFHAQSSIDPPRYCIWLSKANHTYRVALRATHLGIHFLTATDLALAETFGTRSGDHLDKFDGVPTTAGPHGVPILRDSEHWMLVRRTALLDEGGDHVCLAAETVHVQHNKPFTPLRLSNAAHLVPGHANDERNNPPTERATTPSRGRDANSGQ